MKPEAAAGRDTHEPSKGLRRVLGPIDATCIVIGAIIGVGIFFTPSRVAAVAGSGQIALLAWAVGGLIALAGALTFAELGRRRSSAGAQYEILRDAHGPLPAFVFVFCNATAIQAGATAIIAVICAQNLGVAFGGDPPTGWRLLAFAIGLILALTLANILGVRWGSGIQNLTVFAKVATLLTVTLLATLVGRAAGETAGASAAAPASPVALGALGAVLAGLVPAFFSYGGWQHALWISGEVRDPRRNLPIGIVGGVVIVVIVYLLANWAYLKLLGHAGVAQSGALAADAVSAAWPNVGRRAVAAAVGVSALGVLNAQLLSGPRLIQRMADDGRFFRVFALVSGRFGTPAPAILLLGCMALVLLLGAGEKGVDRLLTGVVFIDGVFFVLTGAALFILRHRDADPATRTSAFAYPVAPVLFVLGELGVLVGAYADPTVRDAAYIGAAWIAAAIVLYLSAFRRARSAVDAGSDFA